MYKNARRIGSILTVVILCMGTGLLILTASSPNIGARGPAEVIDTESSEESSLLDVTELTNSLGTAFTISPDGKAWKNDGVYLNVSIDEGDSFTEAEEFLNTIHGLHCHTYGSTYAIFVSLEGGEVWRGVNGEDFSLVYQMNADKYAVSLWSFATSADGVFTIIGEYGTQSEYAAAHISVDHGASWVELFNTSDYVEEVNTTHIHLVSIDPYDDDIYVNVGDNNSIRGLFVSEDMGLSWFKAGYDRSYDSGFQGNGFLACSYPDEYRVIFYTDNMPCVWEYIKETKQLVLLGELTGDYSTEEAKFYCAVTGEYGVSYFTMVTYDPPPNLNYVWLTIDGASFYRISNGTLQSKSEQRQLVAYNGYIYTHEFRFNDLTRDEAATLIEDDTREIALCDGQTRVMDFTRDPGTLLDITVTGYNVTNILSNPSFEGALTGWTANNLYANLSTDYARDGSYCVALENPDGNENAYIRQVVNQEYPINTRLYLMVSVMADGFSYGGYAQSYIPWDLLIEYTYGGNTYYRNLQMGWANVPGDGEWTDYIMTWETPASINLYRLWFRSRMYPTDYTEYVDRIGISEYPVWVNGSEPSGDVSFTLGDQDIEAGELEEGETYNVALGFDVWCDNVTDVIAGSGLYYSVEVVPYAGARAWAGTLIISWTNLAYDVQLASSSEWEATGTGANTYTMHNLDTDLGYRIYKDGEVIATGLGASFSFTATGSGDFSIEIWYPRQVSALIVMTVDMVGLGIVVAVVGGWVMPFTRDIRKGKFNNKPTKMIGEVVKCFIFIMVAITMWVLMKNLVIG